jgi:hypothetical protein
VVDDSDARNFDAKGYQGRQASEEAFGEGYAIATDRAGPASFEMEVPRPATTPCGPAGRRAARTQKRRA